MVYVVFWTGFYPTQNKHMQKKLWKKYPKKNITFPMRKKTPGGLYLHYNFVVALHLAGSLTGWKMGPPGFQ